MVSGGSQKVLGKTYFKRIFTILQALRVQTGNEITVEDVQESVDKNLRRIMTRSHLIDKIQFLKFTQPAKEER